MLFIIISGEVIFMLPFLIPRLYRPLMLEAWGLTNTDIGKAFSAYGISAMFSYILGGHFADKYSPRYLLTISLIATALGGFVLMLSPGSLTLMIMYFFFGISTIFLMWGALIKVTHVFGGEDKRSTAMGILDSGRGLSAALMSTVIVFTVSNFYSDSALETHKANALNIIYTVTITFTFLVAFALWWSLKDFKQTNEKDNDNQPWSLQKALLVLKDMKVWLLGFIILSAYCGYKSIDNYSIYLVDIQGKSLATSSMLTSIIFWLRPICALGAGILADKYHVFSNQGRLRLITFFLFSGAVIQFALASGLFNSFTMVFSTILLSASLAYALRSIYFSIFGDLNIDDNLVGTTVGIASFVGFLPDMFFGLITGTLIDYFPGSAGYNHTFTFTAFLLFMGVICSILLIKILNRGQNG